MKERRGREGEERGRECEGEKGKRGGGERESVKERGGREGEERGRECEGEKGKGGGGEGERV